MSFCLVSLCLVSLSCEFMSYEFLSCELFPYQLMSWNPMWALTMVMFRVVSRSSSCLSEEKKEYRQLTINIQ